MLFRSADVSVKVEVVPSTEMDEDTENQVTEEESQAALAAIAEASMSATPKQSPPARPMPGTFAMRDESPFDDTESENESEDELATNAPLYTVKMSSADFAELSTPKKKLQFEATNTPTKSGLGFTPLVSKLDKWQKPHGGDGGMSFEETLIAASPKGKEAAIAAQSEKLEAVAAPTARTVVETLAGPSPAVPSPAVPSSFFDDEMMIREDEQMLYGDALDTPLNLGEGVILGDRKSVV